MQALEAASEQADRLLHLASRRPHSVAAPTPADGKPRHPFSIHQRLRQLYLEESTHQPPLQYLRPTSHLLEKLVTREQLNTLVLNLYAGNKGYSLCVDMGGNMAETTKFPYQEDQLLGYVDNEELPPALADLLESSHPELYYSGCVIVRVRDYRHSVPATHHVLLRPSTQSLINDVNLLSAGAEWTTEERLALESQLVLATAGPLCLDPSPSLCLVRQRLHHRQQALNTPALRRMARRQSQVAVNRKRKLDQLAAKPLPQLAEFLRCRRTQPPRHHHAPHHHNRNPSLLHSLAKQVKKEPEPSMDHLADVMRLAKPLDQPIETIDCTPLLVEEYILETERGMGRVYYIKLSILQRPSNCEYLGQLYVDKEYREGESNGASCRFSLGSRAQANRYIQQFTEIFTEEGRKSVRITHVVPGQAARVICTAGMRERDARLAHLAQQQQQALKQQVLSVMTHQKLQKVGQKEVGVGADGAGVTLNGLVQGHGHGMHEPMSNGDTHAPHSHHAQQSKPMVMTNPAISALANELQNSAQKYQQQQAAAAAAAASNASNTATNAAPTMANHGANPALLSILNSTAQNHQSNASHQLSQLLAGAVINPAQAKSIQRKMIINPRSTQTQSGQQVRPVLIGSPPGRTLVPAGATVQYTTGVRRMSDATVQPATSLGLSMPGLSALLAGTPSADNPVPGVTNSGSPLLERLSTPPSYPSPAPKPPPAPSPTNPPNSVPTPQAINLNLASVQGALAQIPGLQNVQVSIPGLSSPMTIALNNSSPHLVTSLPVSASLPMTSTNLVSTSQGATLVFTNPSSVTAQLLSTATAQTLRTTGTPTTCNIGGQSIQLVGLQKPRSLVTATSNKPPTLMARSVINNQRHTLKVGAANTVVRAEVSGASGQVLTLAQHQQIQIALQKQLFAQAAQPVKHQRRRSTTENK